MKWSQLKKRVESLFADSVKSRVKLGNTRYRKSHDQAGARGWIIIDKKETINLFDDAHDWRFTWNLPPSWRVRETPKGMDLYPQGAYHRDMLTWFPWYWTKSLFDYLNASIIDILDANNPIIRAIGMLDARVGKQRLKRIVISKEHPLVKRLFRLRCEAEGLDSLAKSVKEFKEASSPIGADLQEEDRAYEKELVDRLSKAKTTRNPRSLITAIYNKNLSEEELDTDISKEIFKTFKGSPDTSLVFRTLLALDQRSKLLKDLSHVRGVIALINDCESWIRPIEQWIPSTRNADRQFSSLARHLMAKYDVPEFMDQAYLRDNPLHQRWFKVIGTGNNIRNAEDLPVPLTKKMAHYFLTAPDHYSVEGAIRWGQVHALGGDRRLADALLETRIVDDFRDNDFWSSVIWFFIRNPMLDTTHVNPIIDYIWNQKYENRVVFVERGVAEEIGPENPGFSMRGRTANSLLRQVEAWHRRLGWEEARGDLQWKRSGIGEFRFIEGTKESKNMKVWKILELLSSKELTAEGRKQGHCVASYARSCQSGASSIWTMEVETEQGVEKLITIEVRNQDSQIRQARGKRNRKLTEKEKEILKRWATKESLLLASYLE